MAPPPHKPTEDSRKLVSAMAGLGAPQDYMARQIGIGEVQLRRHYADQLKWGMESANMQVARTLFRMAVSGVEPSATFFWMKTRAGWRETLHLDHTVNGKVSVDVRNASDEDLEKQRKTLERRTTAADRARAVAASVPGGIAGVVH